MNRSLDDLLDLAPGFVMRTLTLEEQTAVERALRDPALASVLLPEIEAHRATIELLATAQAVAPPPNLRGRVQERLAREAQAPAERSSARAEAAPAAGNESVRTTSAPPSARPSRALPIGLALAFAASAIMALKVQGDVRTLRATVDEQTRELAVTRQQLAQREATMRTLTEGGNALLLVRLKPNEALGPSLQVFWNTKSGAAVIHAAGLKPLPSTRTYVLWMIRDGKPESVALFRPDASGSQLVSDIRVPTSVAGVAAFAVTEEPAGGSPQPTMTPFLVGAVKAE